MVGCFPFFIAVRRGPTRRKVSLNDPAYDLQDVRDADFQRLRLAGDEALPTKLMQGAVFPWAKSNLVAACRVQQKQRIRCNVNSSH
jgi:hypothetical protein